MIFPHIHEGDVFTKAVSSHYIYTDDAWWIATLNADISAEELQEKEFKNNPH